MRGGWYLAVGLAGLALGGCRAQVDTPDGGDLAGFDGSDDLSADVDGGSDLASTDLACSGPIGPEVCSNGCDDDHNGYTDADDPACTPQVLVTISGGTPTLLRLKLGATPGTLTVDGNAVPAGAFATHERSFSAAAFLVREGALRTVRRVALAGGGGTGSFSDFNPTYSGSTRDVCVFNGELIVVERYSTSVLHRFSEDGKTEKGMVSLGLLVATGCASDGNLLYVAVHDSAGNPSQFLVFDKNLAPAPGSPMAMPPSLASMRCQDLAWTPFGFYGLFTSDLSGNDPGISVGQIYPFAFDGGVGAPIDAGTLHGIGTFLP